MSAAMLLVALLLEHLAFGSVSMVSVVILLVVLLLAQRAFGLVLIVSVIFCHQSCCCVSSEHLGHCKSVIRQSVCVVGARGIMQFAGLLLIIACFLANMHSCRISWVSVISRGGAGSLLVLVRSIWRQTSRMKSRND